MLNCTESERRGGFTLIELLVVIAIIAILAALLLPVLATSKDKALRTTCINDMKQMAIAFNTYALDNQEWMAFPQWDGGGMGPQGWLYDTSTGQQIPNPDLGAYVGHENLAWSGGVWFPYLHNPKSYLCPVDVKSPTYINKTARNNRLCSFVMNGAVCGYGPSTRHCKITQPWSPMCYLMWEPDENNLGPGNPGAFDWNDGANFPNASEGIGRLHSNKGGSIIAIMGHVQFVSRKAFRADGDTPQGQGPGPGGKTYLWWSPFRDDGH